MTDYTCENCEYRNTWDCEDGWCKSRCSEFKLDEDTLNEEERKMTRVLEYNNHYNTEHWEYWATKMKMFCKPGEITDGCLVLSE
jgi:hypothetical protein